MSKNVIIDFAKIQGPVFTGRPRGEALRQKLQLDAVDNEDVQVSVKIPDSTYTISSSFVLGLLGQSVVKAGSKEDFYRKFHFEANELFTEVIDSCVSRALQSKNIFSH